MVWKPKKEELYLYFYSSLTDGKNFVEVNSIKAKKLVITLYGSKKNPLLKHDVTYHG
jgi:hypothetical protein